MQGHECVYVVRTQCTSAESALCSGHRHIRISLVDYAYCCHVVQHRAGAWTHLSNISAVPTFASTKPSFVVLHDAYGGENSSKAHCRVRTARNGLEESARGAPSANDKLSKHHSIDPTTTNISMYVHTYIHTGDTQLCLGCPALSTGDMGDMPAFSAPVAPVSMT